MQVFQLNRQRFVIIVVLTIIWGVLANVGTASAHSLTYQDVAPLTQLHCLSVSVRKTSFDTRTVATPPGAMWEYTALIVITNGCGRIARGDGTVRNSVTCPSGVSNSSTADIDLPNNTSQRTFSFSSSLDGRCVIFENGKPVRTRVPSSATVRVNVAVDITADGSVFSIAEAAVTFP